MLVTAAEAAVRSEDHDSGPANLFTASAILDPVCRGPVNLNDV
jgi:hypothetical protein